MRKLFISGALLAILICSFLVWRSWLLAVPTITRPAVQMPSPNAYDFYVEAGCAIIPPDKPVDAIQDKPLIPKSQWKAHYPIATKLKWLQLNKNALRLVREGFNYHCRIPQKKSVLNGSDEQKVFRAIGQMLIVESRIHSEQGNWAKASNSALDTLQFGFDMARGGAITDSLSSIAITAPAFYEFSNIIPRLNKAETRAVAQRVSSILEQRPHYTQIMTEEKYLGQAGMIEFFQYSDKWRLRSPVDEKGQFQWDAIPKIPFTSRRQLFKDYTTHMDKRIAQANMTYNAGPAHISVPHDIYSQFLTPMYQRAYWNHTRAETKAAFLLTELALHSYQLDHGRYPQTLDALVPHYIKELPIDPFGKDEILRYKQTQGKYLLYSVGPDGRDDDGRVVENKKISKEKRSRYVLAPESKGDFVAGVNN